MVEDTATTCARHPGTETRLSCSACTTPICPRCSVQTPVGQKCPACARLPASARRRGKPRQYAKGAAAGLAVAAAAVFLLPVLWGLPLLGFLAAFGAGLAVGEAVRRGAEGNHSPPFRNLAVVLALVAVGGAMFMLIGFPPVRGPLSLLSYAVAAWGAWARF